MLSATVGLAFSIIKAAGYEFLALPKTSPVLTCLVGTPLTIYAVYKIKSCFFDSKDDQKPLRPASGAESSDLTAPSASAPVMSDEEENCRYLTSGNASVNSKAAANPFNSAGTR